MKKDLSKKLALRTAIRELEGEFIKQYDYLSHLSGEPYNRPMPELSKELKTSVEFLFQRHLQKAQETILKGE